MKNKMYIGNLNYKVSEGDIRDLFGSYGDVEEVHLISDRKTGRPRGFGFVTMETPESASKAIESLNGEDFQGRDLTVNLAREKQHD